MRPDTSARATLGAVLIGVDVISTLAAAVIRVRAHRERPREAVRFSSSPGAAVALGAFAFVVDAAG